MTPVASGKLMSPDDVVARLEDGMTVGIGGWGSGRKPMALVRAILRSSLTDLPVVSYGGPDVGLLCAAGRVRKAVYGFVSLDSVPIEPHFARARQAGTIEVEELDEQMLLVGLQAAAHRLPFQVTRTGLGSDVLRHSPHIRTVVSPYEDGEELVAMPALRLDAALVHLDLADARGNARYLGVDPYFDDLFCLAADQAFVSVERVVDTADLGAAEHPQSMLLHRAMVSGVVEAPGGAHFTAVEPGHPRDEAFQRHYVAAARDEAAWAAFTERFLAGTEADYQAAVRAFHAEQEDA